ncbi:MAG: (4Fe-4S)-binding protein [Desulfobacteraceae bacterium]|nr:MAG: (4Fe-4S)-binding protein [Desulfobacteraceae bacterium]
MKELVVISGKGGTGKTSLLAAFASLAEKKVLCDADVDAADLHLILNPMIRERHDFVSGHTAGIDAERCTRCGLCRELCRWNAIDEDFVVDAIACEGCGVCYYFCPEKAIAFPSSTCGEWFLSDTRFGPMAHARLGIAEENSGKLVTLIRQEGKKLAAEKNLDLLLTDGPPGIGCPVIASLGGATAVLIVAEPTVSGRHDMERVVQLSDFFKIPAMVCINKFDLNPGQAEAIEHFARENNVEVVGRIPFDPVFTKAMVQGQTICEYDGSSQGAAAVRKIWERVAQRLTPKRT